MSRDVLLERYEAQAASLAAAGHALAFANARTALAAILRAAGLAPGDEVLLSPLTCQVVPLVVLSLQLVPKFVDISATTLNLAAGGLDAQASARTGAVLFQHTYGSAAGLDDVAAWTDAHGCLLVEDRAQCLPLQDAGASGRRGRASIFSNNLLKPLPAGSGGLAVTDDPEFARRIESVRCQYRMPSWASVNRLRVEAWVHDHLLTPRSYWPFLKFFERVDRSYHGQAIDQEIDFEIGRQALQASAYQLGRGLQSLSQLNAYASHRRLCTAEYAGGVRGITGVEVPTVDESFPLYYFPVLVRHKQALLATASRHLLEIVAWPRTTPIYPVDDGSRLIQYGYQSARYPIAESIASRLVGLPTHRKVTAHHRARILQLLKETNT